MKIKYYGDEIGTNEKSLVLCGPTPRSDEVKSWRPTAIKILEELQFDGIVYVPEYKSEICFNYEEQVNWEREVYKSAKIIIFWVPRKKPDMLGLTTNVEFGYWLKTGKCIYGRPSDAERVRYLDWLYKLEYDEKPYYELKELLKKAISLVNKKDDE